MNLLSLMVASDGMVVVSPLVFTVLSALIAVPAALNTRARLRSGVVEVSTNEITNVPLSFM
jgi:hypothetical protein